MRTVKIAITGKVEKLCVDAFFSACACDDPDPQMAALLRDLANTILQNKKEKVEGMCPNCTSTSIYKITYRGDDLVPDCSFKGCNNCSRHWDHA